MIIIYEDDGTIEEAYDEYYEEGYEEYYNEEESEEDNIEDIISFTEKNDHEAEDNYEDTSYYEVYSEENVENGNEEFIENLKENINKYTLEGFLCKKKYYLKKKGSTIKNVLDYFMEDYGGIEPKLIAPGIILYIFLWLF